MAYSTLRLVVFDIFNIQRRHRHYTIQNRRYATWWRHQPLASKTKAYWISTLNTLRRVVFHMKPEVDWWPHTCVRCCHCDDFHSATTGQIRHRNSDNGTGNGKQSIRSKARHFAYIYLLLIIRAGRVLHERGQNVFCNSTIDGAEQNFAERLFCVQWIWQ